MKYLEELYTISLFYEALEGVCVADDDAAYNLYKEGKYFEGLPFFESSQCVHRKPNNDVESADRNLAKEMKLHAKHKKATQWTIYNRTL